MNGVVTTKLIDDGDSVVVVIPDDMLETSGLSGAVELEVKDGTIIISKIKSPREGRARTGVDNLVDQEHTDWNDSNLVDDSIEKEEASDDNLSKSLGWFFGIGIDDETLQILSE